MTNKDIALTLGLPREPGDKRPIYLTDIHRSAIATGAPGSGKTYSFIDPLIRSAIAQGLPIFIYDFKYPEQTARHIAFAKRQGYRVDVLALGHPESQTINLLDFLRDDKDTARALEIADVLYSNFVRQKGQDREDSFFANAGKRLIQAALARAKGTKYPDMAMAHAILSLPLLGFRIENDKGCNPWVRSQFDQLVSVRDSEKTAASIVGTATSVFGRMMIPDILPSLIEKSTIPLDVHPRQLLIFGMHREKQSTVAPILATVLHMLLTRHIAKDNPGRLLVVLDELPTLYLPDLPKWINICRELGVGFVLAVQNLAQIDRIYGEKARTEIFGACATKAIYNPQDYRTAQMLSDYMGKMDVLHWQRSFSRGKNSHSRSRTHIRQTRALLEPYEILKLKTGEGILISPGFQDAREAYLPLKMRVTIPEADLRLSVTSQQVWREVIRPHLQTNSTLPEIRATDIQLRRAQAEELMPIM